MSQEFSHFWKHSGEGQWDEAYDVTGKILKAHVHTYSRLLNTCHAAKLKLTLNRYEATKTAATATATATTTLKFFF